LSFSGAITIQFCFTCTLDGVTAMPRGPHARLCHAFGDPLDKISDTIDIIWQHNASTVFTERRYASAAYAIVVSVHPSVCTSQVMFYENG